MAKKNRHSDEALAGIGAVSFIGEIATTMNRLLERNEIETFDCGELGCFVWNRGTKQERAEILLAMLPVVMRIAKRI